MQGTDVKHRKGLQGSLTQPFALIPYIVNQIAPMRKTLAIIALSLLLVLSGYLYWKFWFVFGEGTKTGELNYLVRKGYLFKTYEGKLIQTGFRSRTQGVIQSYEFEFSVDDEAVARELMSGNGRTYTLHYREYLGTLPWRGYSVYVVDSIVTSSSY
jgi:hypothetical protein